MFIDKKSSELEEEFKVIYELGSKQIAAQLEIAENAIKTAVELSKKFGIPFITSYSKINQSYVPGEFVEKFGELNDLFLDGDILFNYDVDHLKRGGGWKHSAIC